MTLHETLLARQSERDSAELALAAALSGLDDATGLLDRSHAELRAIEARIDECRLQGEETGALAELAHMARDRVASCEVVVHEARRIVDEYEAEIAALNDVVAALERRLAANE